MQSVGCLCAGVQAGQVIGERQTSEGQVWDVIENWEGRGFSAENENSVGAGARGELANADSAGCTNTYTGMG